MNPGPLQVDPRDGSGQESRPGPPRTPQAESRIDRRAVVERHSPQVDRVLPEWPLQLGNGEFGFAVDVSGLQTWPQRHPHRHDDAIGTLLGTMAQWAWHSIPPPRPYELSETWRDHPTPRGPRTYVDLDRQSEPGEPVRGTEAAEWLRNNPHRLHLGQIGFVTDLDPESLTGLEQRLDLWTGVVTSRYDIPGAGPAEVRTAVHPHRDAVGVSSTTGWPIALRFPYGSQAWAIATDWDQPQRHTTVLLPHTTGADEQRRTHRILRTLDDSQVCVSLTTDGIVEQTADHTVTVSPAPGSTTLALTVEFVPGHDGRAEPLRAEEVARASSVAWNDFWGSGGWIDFDGTQDPRAVELERRIVLSQYLTRVNCAASIPPAETGLLTNSWRGKGHLEMHWWHVAHFALWGRPELIEPSLDWYASILDQARETARRHHCRGVRWPKQVDSSGRESPSDIGTFLLWQQPHPINLAELVVRAHRARGDRERAAKLQERWSPLVFASAAFMADIAEPQGDGSYGLGPPLVPAQESYGAIRDRLTNPAFELAYWRWGLQIALRWQEELGLEPDPDWRAVADGIRAPHVVDGRLTAIDVEPWTLRTDHPSMLAAYGFVPPVGLVKPSVARATLNDVMADWDWESTWGWDCPVLAMTAARLADPQLAVDGLLMPVTKNTHGPNGHNRQTDRLPAYLPGNGGLLAAVALMVAGWDGGPRAPGIPQDWTVRQEGLVPSPG